MPASQPPPSSAQIPGKSSNSGPYLAGIVLLALLAAGLFYWKSQKATPAPPPPPATVAATPAEPTPPPMLYAPPPPPKIEEEPDAGAAQPAAKSTGPSGPAPGLCSCKVMGTAPSALADRLRATAASAQGCYTRALRTSEASGNLTVNVQVSPTGSVCGASIVNDSIHSGEISTCVLNKFRGAQFPAPSGGCANVNIPISFKLKQ